MKNISETFRKNNEDESQQNVSKLSSSNFTKIDT
jgi:hypothetical protein